MSNAWNTLSAIDVSEHAEKKGKFTYLSWSWAWSTLMSHYPDATYTIDDDLVYEDGTMEVRVSLTVESITHTMFLPVLNYQNNAISNPSAFDINTARMRCLVKAMAMFGLGHYIYAGTDLPQAPTHTDAQLSKFNELLVAGDPIPFKAFQDSLDESVRDSLFNSAPQGEKTKLKEKARKLYMSANERIKLYLGTLSEAIAKDDAGAAQETISELTDIEMEYVKNALTELDRLALEGMDVRWENE